ncbi:MAG TPA: hypothetical protein VL738_13675, partial [Dactylosporangium sp.]|nr:hypothetical protein [Dactylosporangium sp.]
MSGILRGVPELTFRPLGDPRRHRELRLDELAAVYDSPEAGPGSTFRRDHRSASSSYAAAIVSIVDDGRCVVVLRAGREDRFQVEPGADDDEVTVAMAG